ncbi:MAG TPA: hypothetical protein V6D35_01405 [Candidatus Sericytochromatia bacterium]
MYCQRERSLLTNPLTASKVKRLIDAHPEWGFCDRRSGGNP